MKPAEEEHTPAIAPGTRLVSTLLMTSQVEELVTEFRGKLPQSEGIILHPEIRKSVRKRAQQILKKYSSLPLSVRRGRQKSDCIIALVSVRKLQN